MTPQEVIKSFMAKLAEDANLSGTNKLNSAVAAVSKYSSISDAIAAMKADQIAAEKEAVEEVLGSSYAGKTISQVSSSILSADAKTYDTNNIGNAYLNQWNDQRTTVERLIKERKATIFLEKYCGIQLARKYWINSSDAITSWSSGTTGNVDTGAITGSDANISLKAGDVVGNVTLTAANLQTLALKEGNSLSGDTLIIGTGTEKTDRSVVLEIGNKYTATTSQAQNIKTGTNDWIVVATNYNDTITTGGADSVNAGAGNDQITVGADYASILTGAGNDTVEISASVKNVTLGDLNSSDVLKISGTFNVGSAQIEDTVLVITDKTGTRKIRLGDFDTAKNAKINSTTIGAWLTNAGINLNNLSAYSSSNELPTSDEPAEVSSTGDGGEGQIAGDPDYTPTPIKTTATDDNQDLPQRSSNSLGTINVNLDNVTLTGGNLDLDGSKVGEISNEFPNVSSFTKNGLTINLVGTTSNTSGYPSNFTSKTYDQLTADQKTIVAGLFKWWGKECLKLNEESYGISFNSDTAMVKEIGLYFYDGNGSSNTLAAVWNWSSGANTTKLMLNVNMDYYKGIKEDNLDGQSSVGGAGLLDRTLAHEFTHAMMATNISYFNSLPKFIKEGMAELTHGIDDFRPTNIFKIAYDADWLDGSLDLANTGTGNQNIGDGYSGGYMFLRYFAKQAALQAIADDLQNTTPLPISLTPNNDNYTNTLASATVLALAGDDNITNKGANAFIDGGEGKDRILNSLAANVTMTGGEGNDAIENYYAQKVSIATGTGNDTVYNYSNRNSIANDVTIDTGADNDRIYNYDGSNVSIAAGAGDDYILSSRTSLNVTLDGGAGNDQIYSSGNKVTIIGGTGNDSINNSGGANVLLKYAAGDGFDTIYGFNATSTLQIGNGTATDTYSKTIDTVSGNVFVSVGSGVITLNGAATLSTLNIAGKEVSTVNPLLISLTPNNDTYNNTLASATILALAGNDSIVNTSLAASVSIDGGDGADTIKNGDFWSNNVTGASKVTISGGSGKDSISNDGLNALLSGGDDDDTITNDGSNATINGGDGNDSLWNTNYSGNGNKSSVNGGSDNDIIHNFGNEVTIVGGKGNDSIGNNYYLSNGSKWRADSGLNVLFKYTSGDGNDFIGGFVASSTLQIGNGTTDTFTSVKSGNDFIIKVGDGNITLNGAASLSTVHVAGTYVGPGGSKWVIRDGYAEYIKDEEVFITIYNISSNAKVTDFSDPVNNIVTIVKNALSTDEENNTFLEGEGYTLKFANDVPTVSVSTPGGWSSLVGGKATYTATSWTDYYELSENTAIYYKEKGGEKCTLSGIISTLPSAVAVDEENRTVTLKKAALGISDVTLDGDSFSLALDDSVPQTETTVNGWSDVVNGTASYSTGGKSKYYELSGNEIFYHAQEAGVLQIKLSGLSSTAKTVNGNIDGLTVSGKALTISKAAVGNNVALQYNNGFTVNLASDVKDISFTGMSSADTITNNGSNVSVFGGAGNDSIVNNSLASSAKIYGGDGVDTISNYAASVSIDGGAGSDYLYNYSGGTKATITGGDGVDTISNYAASVSIDGGAGNDYIYNSPASVIIDVGDGADTVYNSYGHKAKISLGAGNDSLYNYYGNSISVDAGAGNDSLYNYYGSNMTIDAGDGNDSVKNYGAYSTLNAGAGADTVYNYNSYNSINGGAGNDYIYSSNSYVTINGGADNDTISTSSNSSKYLSINGGTGNDYMNTNATYTTILGGDGNDTITNCSNATNDRFDGGAGNDSIKNFAANVSINGGADNDTITNSGSSTTIDGGSGNDLITNSGSYVSINAGASNDNITNSGSYVTIDSGSGNDTVTNNAASNVTINTAQGDDSIKLGTSVKSFKAEGFYAGDVIELATSATKLETISGGIKAGNVSISGITNIATVTNGWNTLPNGISYGQSMTAGAKLSGTKITYDSLSGSSTFFTITGITSTVGVSLIGKNVTLYNTALNGVTGTVSISGGDYKLKLASDVPTVSTVTSGWKTLTSGNVAYLEGSKSAYYLLSGDGKSVTYNASVAGANKVELSGVKNNLSTPSGKTVNLTANNFNSSVVGVASNAGGYQFALSGAFANKKFTGASIGADTITNNGSNIVIDGSAGNDKITNNGSNVSVFGGVGNDSIVNNSFASSAKIYGGDGADTVYNYAASVSVDGGAGNDKITNSGSNVSIGGGAGNDTVTNSGFSVTITGGDGEDVFSYSKGSFKITDYAANVDKVSLDIAKVEDVTLSNKDTILKLGQSDSITIANGKDKKITVAKNKVAQYIFDNHAIFNSGKTAVSLLATIPAFNANSYSNLVTVDAIKTTKPINIIGNANANVIFAGNNGSTLNGKAGNDSLWGGEGVDVFVYEKDTGNDFIYNFTSGQDKITLGSGASISGFSVTEAGDALLKINKTNNLTIKKAAGDDIPNKGKVITIIDSTGKETTQTYFPNQARVGKKVNLLAEYKGSFTAPSNIATVNATQVENPVVLKGNTLANMIQGGSKNDTLYGGKGNDKLSGNAGKDMFVFSAGKDTINDYVAGYDKVSISSGLTYKSFNVNGSDVVLNYGSDNLTIAKGAGKKITFADNSTKTYGKNGLFNAENTAVTLPTSAKTFSAAGYSKLVTIDATTASSTLTITGNNLSNVIKGGASADTLSGGAGADKLYGNAGNDSILGGDGNDTLTGGAGADKLYGNAGNDSILGGDGNDTLTGGAGADKLYGNAGNDSILGGDGNDTLSGGTGADKLYGNAGNDSILGGDGNDTLSGGTGADKLYGNIGNDSLLGGDGNDTLDGGSGNDTLSGGAGADKLYGGYGNDSLAGGVGNDSLWGGTGNDTFIYKPGEGIDKIFDYSSGDMLKILKTNGKEGGSFTKSTFSGDELTLNIQGGGTVIFDGVSKGNKFNINGKNYTISGKNLK